MGNGFYHVNEKINIPAVVSVMKYKMEGVIIKDWSTSASTNQRETESEEPDTSNTLNDAMHTDASERSGESTLSGNVGMQRHGRPKRNCAQEAQKKIQAVLAWEGCAENSQMFQTVANKIEAEMEHEKKRRKVEPDEEDLYDGASEFEDVDDKNSVAGLSEDSYGRDSFVVSDDEGESVEEGESEEEFFSASSDVEESSGDSDESNN